MGFFWWLCTNTGLPVYRLGDLVDLGKNSTSTEAHAAHLRSKALEALLCLAELVSQEGRACLRPRRPTCPARRTRPVGSRAGAPELINDMLPPQPSHKASCVQPFEKRRALSLVVQKPLCSSTTKRVLEESLPGKGS